jgi:hypothetical protein
MKSFAPKLKLGSKNKGVREKIRKKKGREKEG